MGRLLNMKMNYKEFLEIIKAEKFEVKTYDKQYYPEFEALFDYGNIAVLFDDLMKENDGIPPTQQEYVEAGLVRAKKFFDEKDSHWIYKTRKYHQFVWDERLIKAVKNRLARTYPSFLIEIQVQLYLLNKYDVKLACNEYLDMNFGVDITVLKDKKLYYIHIAKNSRWSRDMIKEKGNRKSYIMKNNKKHYWTRNWGSAHHLLLFNDIDSDRMQNVNGNILFADSYLDRYFDDLFESGEYEEFNSKSEFHQFAMFLKKNGLLKGDDY